MLFNSLEYLCFLVMVVGGYYVIPFQWRWLLLLLASYFFYAWWKPAYLLLIVLSTLVDYYVALRLAHISTPSVRRCLLLVSITSNLGLLFFFKYFSFFNSNISSLAELMGYTYRPPLIQVLLPVGISFYTFQTLSYTIDVYHGKIAPERHAGYFALFVVFFPQLVAGPIERAAHLLPQLRQSVLLEAQNISRGAKLIMWGLFKKVVIADNLAPYVNEVYNHPEAYVGITFVLATLFFGFQIYYDFSGYSDIAVGSARMLGIELVQNFYHPYFADSLTAFWRRWHISLSSWFRDYLYIPLGGSRYCFYRNILITFLLSGLWHGANWTFFFWGLWHGICLATERLLQPISLVSKGFRLVSFIATQLTVFLGWIFFRANDINEALIILQRMSYFSTDIASVHVWEDGKGLLFLIILLLIMQFVHYLEKERNIMEFMEDKPRMQRWSFYSLLLWILFLYGNYGQQEFIYFTF